MVNFWKKYLISVKSKNELKKYSKYKEKKSLQNKTNISVNKNLFKIRYYKNNLIEKFFLNSYSNLNIIITQYFLNLNNWKKFEKKLLIGISEPITIIGNLSLLKYLSKDLKINYFLSLLIFQFYVIKSFFSGTIYFFYKILSFILRDNKDIYRKIAFSSYFSSLDFHCLNKEFNSDSKIYDLKEWYFKKFDLVFESQYLFHNCKLRKDNEDPKTVYLNSPVNIYNLNTFFYFFLKGLFLIIVSFISILFLRWKLPLLLKEILSAEIIKYTEKKFIFTNYFFSNSSWVFKPLWTYEAEKKNSKVILYFYATNIENINKNDTNINKPINFYQIMTWKNYFIWDKYQKKTLLSLIKINNKKIDNQFIFHEVGPIPYIDKYCKFKLDKKIKNLIIFDIPLYRRSNSFYYDFENRFYRYKVLEKFYLDIINNPEITKSKKINLYIKTKSLIEPKFHDKRYNNLLKKISKKVNFIDPNISVYKLAKNFDGCISLPFTSTSRIFNILGKKAAYYDPLNFFKSDHKAAKNIKLLRYNDLNKWIKNL